MLCGSPANLKGLKFIFVEGNDIFGLGAGRRKLANSRFFSGFWGRLRPVRRSGRLFPPLIPGGIHALGRRARPLGPRGPGQCFELGHEAL